ncbi:aldo/keto reductase [Pyrobaculum ferrireducens]|uniref:aldo/keto reductase n=1 Tax=Pyrobaculum ferrireducens TaxID=1104324 RepID=UPI0011E4E364|nr:aldo/keto reductase [Pyrobaculum ferrireducens]
MKCVKSVWCVPEIGLGTFGIGGDFWRRDDSNDFEWVRALRRGFELGLRLVDTSELYGDGHAEELIKIAASGVEEVLVVSKIHPTTLEPEEVFKRLSRSAERLGRRPWIAMLHWVPAGYTICDVVKVLEAAVARGLADHYGLSNVTHSQLASALTCAKKLQPAAVENRYSLRYRRDELDVLPLAQREGLLYLGYSALERGALALDPLLGSIGRRYEKSAVQIALNWYTKIPNVVPVVKASNARHVEEIAQSIGWEIKEEDWKLIDKQFYIYRLQY